MKCRKHPVDPSSAVGVCATCLRERLFALIAAQAQAEALGHAGPCADDDRRKPDDPQQQQQPPPRRPPQHLAFPRSVSPYISRRKSDAVACGGGGRHQRFYSTPQVGPAYRYSDAAGGFVPSEPRKKKKRGRFSLFASLFGKSRSEKFDSESDPRFSSDSDPALFRHRDSCRATPSWSSSASSSSSWFSFLLHRRGKGRPPVGGFPAEEEAVSAFDARRPRPVSNRGMSPERGNEESDDEDRENRSPPGSGYASETSRGRRRTPPAGPAPRGPRPGLQSRNVSGLSFCLSPLVRPSPARQWNNHHHHPHLPKCGLQHPDAGYSGEIRAPGHPHPHPHLSTAASYRANRSRKLADFGRANPNR